MESPDYNAPQPDSFLPSEATEHYATDYEATRLAQGTSRLELARSQELLLRYLPQAPAIMYDIGGGPGAYALWLAGLGYEVHLRDALRLHVAHALTASARQPERPLASAMVGDARHLDRPDASADVVLLMGPLYHLTERDDRVQALREARRVLRDGGLLAAVGIARATSALDGLFHGLFDDPLFAPIVERDLRDGQHRNPTDNPTYFTTAYFHRPDDLRAEIEAAGLRHEITLPIEGPAWLLPDFDARWQDTTRREQLLRVVRMLENEPSALGMSAHLMAFGRK